MEPSLILYLLRLSSSQTADNGLRYTWFPTLTSCQLKHLFGKIQISIQILEGRALQAFRRIVKTHRKRMKMKNWQPGSRAAGDIIKSTVIENYKPATKNVKRIGRRERYEIRAGRRKGASAKRSSIVMGGGGKEFCNVAVCGELRVGRVRAGIGVYRYHYEHAAFSTSPFVLRTPFHRPPKQQQNAVCLRNWVESADNENRNGASQNSHYKYLHIWEPRESFCIHN